MPSPDEDGEFGYFVGFFVTDPKPIGELCAYIAYIREVQSTLSRRYVNHVQSCVFVRFSLLVIDSATWAKRVPGHPLFCSYKCQINFTLVNWAVFFSKGSLDDDDGDDLRFA